MFNKLFASDFAETVPPALPSMRFLLLFGLLALPSFINDFSFIALDGTQLIYLVDYAWRLLTLLLAVVFLRELAFATGQPKRHPVIAFAGACLLLLLLLVIRWNTEEPLRDLFGSFSLFSYPRIETAALYWFDLTIGLWLVAISEEIVFRRVAFRALASVGCNFLSIVIIASVLFALMHWSKGPANVVSSFLIGAVLMLLYRWTGRLWPVVIVHWVYNVLVFA